MGDRRLYIIECLHMLGTTESERLKVTALNLLENAHLAAASRRSAHPTAPPAFQEVGFFILRQSLMGERVGWRKK
jgi:hypothetical protein